MECASVLWFNVMGLWNVLPSGGDGGMGGMECATVLGFSVMGLWNVLPS